MSTIAEQLADIKAAKARGVLKAQINGESVEYVSLAAMNAIIADLEAQLGTAPSRQTYPRFIERP